MGNLKMKVVKKWNCDLNKFNNIKNKINYKLNEDIDNCLYKVSDTSRYKDLPKELAAFLQLEDIKKYGNEQYKIEHYYYPKMLELFNTIELFLHTDDIEVIKAVIELNLEDDYLDKLFTEVVTELNLDYAVDVLTQRVFIKPKLTEEQIISFE